MDCIFCKIINGDIPAYTLYEDDIVKCFLDVNPITNGHMLIIPKEHYTALKDIDLDVLSHIMKISKLMEEKIMIKLNPDGLKLVQNNGFIQEVKHYHLHLIPAYKNEQEMIDVKEIYEKLK